jgi:hypothetical protein
MGRYNELSQQLEERLLDRASAAEEQANAATELMA